ncbi:hypothetical protein [Sandaracinus amylolyticus]|uniref:hypothetical protein n=1 Tax=Sandaracinus amylolyticus TaxID=927083 RepID=UPI001F479193|nr:hypothetical protein [Sandaracinus amylolyticus]UJR83271.1 Hypothetical protein I5071_53380 [Sandaracinus amylolyticus]
MPATSYSSVPHEPADAIAVHPEWRFWLEDVRDAGVARGIAPGALPPPFRELLRREPSDVLRGVVLAAYYLGRDASCSRRAFEDGIVDLPSRGEIDVERALVRCAAALALPLEARRTADGGREVRLGTHVVSLRGVATHARIAVRRGTRVASIDAWTIMAAINLLLAASRDARRFVPLRSAPGLAVFLPLRRSQAGRLAAADQIDCERPSDWSDLFDASAPAGMSGVRAAPRWRDDEDEEPASIVPLTKAKCGACEARKAEDARRRATPPPPPAPRAPDPPAPEVDRDALDRAAIARAAARVARLVPPPSPAAVRVSSARVAPPPPGVPRIAPSDTRSVPPRPRAMPPPPVRTIPPPHADATRVRVPRPSEVLEGDDATSRDRRESGFVRRAPAPRRTAGT